ncbi:hypothetical protein JOM56_013413 [Amanita muscaria]
MRPLSQFTTWIAAVHSLYASYSICWQRVAQIRHNDRECLRTEEGFKLDIKYADVVCTEEQIIFHAPAYALLPVTQ